MPPSEVDGFIEGASSLKRMRLGFDPSDVTLIVIKRNININGVFAAWTSSYFIPLS